MTVYISVLMVELIQISKTRIRESLLGWFYGNLWTFAAPIKKFRQFVTICRKKAIIGMPIHAKTNPKGVPQAFDDPFKKFNEILINNFL